MKVLVVAAHPDDEVLGCGGYMARLSESHDVFTAIVTEGASQQYAGEGAGRMMGMKKSAAEEANRLLGARGVFFGGFPDMRLDTVSHVEINGFLDEVLRELRPELILTHHPGDLNLDHQIVYRSTMAAARPAGRPAADILLYETISSTEWQGYDSRAAFVPNVFIDISSTLERKLEALAVYGMELREWPHPRSEQGVRACARFRGLYAGLEAAEGFCLLRAVDFGVRP